MWILTHNYINFQMIINLCHRWPIRSYLQRSNGLDALFKTTCQYIFRKFDLKLSNICFRLSIWPIGTANHKNINFRNGYLKRTRRPGGLFCPLIQLRGTLGFASHCLFGPGRTWTSTVHFCKTKRLVSWYHLNLWTHFQIKVSYPIAQRSPSF
jgi:hypothetical protein